MFRFTARRADDGTTSIYLEDKDRLHFVAVMEPRPCALELAQLLAQGANALLAIRELTEAKVRAEHYA